MLDRPQLTVFDCDGVLVDSEGATQTVVMENLSRHGLDLSQTECRDLLIGDTITNAGKKIRAMGTPLPDQWVDEVYEEMFARLKRGVEVVPGVHDILDQLDAHAIPYCVASNGPMAKMEITLKPSGLWTRFKGNIYSAHTLGLEHAKPEPGLFLHACAAMNVSPSNAVVIEDSKNGAIAARAAGIPCFGLCTDTAPEDFLEADASPFDKMSELPILLNLCQSRRA